MPFDFDMTWQCNQDRQNQTMCDLRPPGDNIWYQTNLCRLDELTYADVAYILSRNPKAKSDLYKITTDPNLLALANTVRLLPDPKADGEIAARRINNPAQTLPFYTLFRGNTGGRPGK